MNRYLNFSIRWKIIVPYLTSFLLAGLTGGLSERMHTRIWTITKWQLLQVAIWFVYIKVAGQTILCLIVVGKMR